MFSIRSNNKDIDFLDSYWKEVKRIANNIEENLPKIKEPKTPVYEKGGAKMYIVNFKDLEKTWKPDDLNGRSSTLDILANKISTMIYEGRADGVKRMVESIANNKIKKFTQHHTTLSNRGDFLGHGHFKWYFKAHKLNDTEIKRLKEYFDL